MTREEAISKLNELIECTVDREMIDDICYGVIELLEEQELRVMTLIEWIKAPEPADGECMCYEIKDKGLQAMLVKAFDGVRHLYGKAFRVWTSKPSLKQMKETPWA